MERLKKAMEIARAEREQRLRGVGAVPALAPEPPAVPMPPMVPVLPLARSRSSCGRTAKSS